ncbi:hypothetical protein PVK06_020132 [Gossypium arboreum]|uniref:RNase H type-1 domain-containing protein n=1 Tax=Gossypium arboreum TaxID=29729 RepID=A0ABR0PLX5_GOSAR|nr:hypothetical protein PVK06_020132 [Gossypium arboreum]
MGDKGHFGKGILLEDYFVVRYGQPGEKEMLECMRRGVEKRTLKILQEVRKWKHPPGQSVKINFDVTYDGRLCHSTLGIVARNSEGNVLLPYSEIHQQVTSAFLAEALACRKTAQIGIDMQWPKLIIKATHYQ